MLLVEWRPAASLCLWLASRFRPIRMELVAATVCGCVVGWPAPRRTPAATYDNAYRARMKGTKELELLVAHDEKMYVVKAVVESDHAE